MYDFDTVLDRRAPDACKWNVCDGELPMWVADMDFAAAPEIRAALQARLDHGVFGYSEVPDSWREAYANWWEQRHAFRLQPDWLVFCTGVVPAISSIVRKLTTPGENVLVQTPVYNIFFHSIRNNGRNTRSCPLVYDNGTYLIDFEALERGLADPQTTLMLLCNPQNPGGRIWTRDELARIGTLCEKHHVIVLSDEIHCDLTNPGTAYTPFAAVSDACRENSITCIAPTKAFNLAGLQTAAVSVPNPVLRHKVWRALNTDEIAEPNTFAVHAAIAAFTAGAPWLDALRQYLFENKRRAVQFITDELPMLHAAMPEATYLLWINCRGVTADADGLAAFLRRETGLFLSKGSQYGAGGRAFLRMNLACPRVILEDGLSRLHNGILAVQK